MDVVLYCCGQTLQTGTRKNETLSTLRCCRCPPSRLANVIPVQHKASVCRPELHTLLWTVSEGPLNYINCITIMVKHGVLIIMVIINSFVKLGC